MRVERVVAAGLAILVLAPHPRIAAEEQKPAPPIPANTTTPIALPGAPPDGVLLDYIAVDRPRHRVWVPAGGTGRVDVIDTTTQSLQAIEGFATAEVERQGKRRTIGPTAASV